MEKLNSIKKINFKWFVFNESSVRPENRNNLEFFINSLFKDKNMQFEKLTLKSFFDILWKKDLENFCNENPNNVSFRKAWYLYEKLYEEKLNYVWTKATYTNFLDEEIFFCSTWTKNSKWKIIDNLLWKLDWFNPYIKKDEKLSELINFDYEKEIKEVTDSKTKYLIEKSVDYLFVKETKSSYQIEWEEYNFNKNVKFLNAIKKIEVYENLDKESLVEIHNLVMQKSKVELKVRDFDNYIASGNELMWEILIEYICPKAKDLDYFIQELKEFYDKNKSSLNKILLASIISSFFVFIHPFSDWNWRCSRYLFHYVLKELWFWNYINDKNIIIPISAYILNNRDEYYYNLNLISKDFWKNIDYEMENNWQINIFWKTKEYYLYSDYTTICLYFAEVLYNSFVTDFKEEINFLEKYYKLIEKIDSILDLNDKEKWLVWKFVLNWKWIISKSKIEFLEKNWIILNEKEKNSLKLAYDEVYK